MLLLDIFLTFFVGQLLVILKNLKTQNVNKFIRPLKT